MHIPDAWKKWNTVPLARSRGSIAREVGKLKGEPNFSVKHPPIATLPADVNSALINNVAMDVLHMRMRIGEKMVKNSINASAQHTGDKLAAAFQAIVRGCGVPFTIYETSIHGKNQVAFSSLTGRNWRKLLAEIGPAIQASSGVFPENIRDKLASLFINFNTTLQFAGKCERNDADQVAAQTNAWITDYVAMGFSITP